LEEFGIIAPKICKKCCIRLKMPMCGKVHVP
jgi:hypothetical protein